MVLQSLRDILGAEGHEVATADGGQAGIDAFLIAQKNGASFAAVVTDLGMPYVDGRQVASAIKSAAPGTVVVMLTGWGQRLEAEGDAPAHVDRVVSKPPKLRALRNALAEAWQPYRGLAARLLWHHWRYVTGRPSTDDPHVSTIQPRGAA